MNSLNISGRLTADPKLETIHAKYDGEEIEKVTFSVANGVRFRTKKGKGSGEKVNYFDCVAWRGAARRIAAGFKKGYEIILTNAVLNQREYIDRENKRHYRVEIEVTQSTLIELGRIPSGSRKPQPGCFREREKTDYQDEELLE